MFELYLIVCMAVNPMDIDLICEKQTKAYLSVMTTPEKCFKFALPEFAIWEEEKHDGWEITEWGCAQIPDYLKVTKNG